MIEAKTSRSDPKLALLPHAIRERQLAMALELDTAVDDVPL